MFQDFNLIPALTAVENVSLPLELDGWKTSKARRAALDALSLVELTDRATHYPDDLSGGQQQRVAIARAVVGGRSLILADEPTGALDSATGEIVLRMLRSRVDAGAGGILVTHDARHAAWADRIVFLKDGRIVDQSQRSSPTRSSRQRTDGDHSEAEQARPAASRAPDRPPFGVAVEGPQCADHRDGRHPRGWPERCRPGRYEHAAHHRGECGDGARLNRGAPPAGQSPRSLAGAEPNGTGLVSARS